MLVTDQFVFFYGGIFSNFANTPYMSADGLLFDCSEQEFMYRKATLFGDDEIAEKILNTSSPAKIKSLGRAVRGFDEHIWSSVREELMYRACLAKFSGNESARMALLAQGSRQFVEASPSDTLWGIGLSETSALIHNPANWRGMNLLGKVLNRVRDSICGTSEEAKYCYRYPHPAVTSDCVIFGFDGERIKVLLIERGCEPFKGSWALPGGFVRHDESAEEGALRELKEETQLVPTAIEQLYTYSSPKRDPRERVITVAFVALVKISDVKGGDDARSAKWFALDSIPHLAFDHDLILRDAINHLRERIHFRPVGYDLLPESFTMRQLQALYESVLGVTFDRRNFAKKMLHLEILTPLDRTVRQTPKRASRLYTFNIQKYNELKQRGMRLEF